MLIRKAFNCIVSVLILISVSTPILAQNIKANQSNSHSLANPPFQVIQKNGVWWLQAPNGKRFFSRGVCCVLRGSVPSDYDPNNPGYAAYLHYDSPDAWADTAITRLKSWGFTTVGGWSDLDALRKSPRMNMPFTVFIPIGMGVGAPWLDMWDPKIVGQMDKITRAAILPVRNDPRLIGYFTDNELGWWKGALIQTTLTKQPPSSRQRQLLIALLKRTYGGRWDRLTNDFVPQGASSFAQLGKGGTIFLRPGGNGIVVENRFLWLAAHRYYQLVHDLVRKYDKRGLILGDRYQSFYYPEVAAAASKYVDIQSTNVNANWNDGGLARFYLSTLHSLGHRPLMVTEFYVASAENRSGNKNDSSGFVVVPTQEQRALVFRREMEQFLVHPYVVGADWFQYFDEPQNGRGDGENYDMGLVDTSDRPYSEITGASAALDATALKLRSVDPEPDITLQGAPHAPDDPTAGATDKEMLLNWDRAHSFVKPVSAYPTADLYLCWDRSNIYFGVYSIDPIERGFYTDNQLPDIDSPRLTLRIPGRQQPIVITLNDSGGVVVGGAQGIFVHHFGPADNVRNSTIAVIPSTLFGKDQFAPGDKIAFKASLVSHARAYRTSWQAGVTLAP